MALQNFGPTASPDEVAAATLKDGAAIVSGLVPASLAEIIAGELRENFDNFGYKSKRDFSGHKTSRCHAVLVEAPSSVAIIGHDMVMAVADAILLPHCKSYQIGSITGIEVCPGQEVQELHPDDTVYPVRLPGMKCKLVACGPSRILRKTTVQLESFLVVIATSWQVLWKRYFFYR